MKTEQFEDTNLSDIQKKYSNIDKDWLSLHYIISIGMVLFAFLVEWIISVVLINTNMLSTTIPRYIIKFIMIPSVTNIILIGIDIAVMKSKRLSQKIKIYTVSSIFVLICFVLFTVHSAFIVTFYLFSGAILLTLVYANQKVTLHTALLSMLLFVFSEFFISWDKDKISIYKNTLRLSNFLTAIFILIAFSVICMIVIRYEKKKNAASIQVEEERQLLQQKLKLDDMTGLYNRKALHDSMRDLEDCGPEEKVILTMIDIDKFKNINDHWGHQVGDRCLIEVAKILRESCKKAVSFRYGGDEFCLLFHELEMEEAVYCCEQIQSKLKNIIIEEAPELRITVSFGMAPYYMGLNSAQLFVQADHALYEAKRERNRIKVYNRQISLYQDH